MYLKFAENVDILVQIVNAKLYNEREKNNGYNGCQKILKTFVEENCFSSLYFPVVLQYNIQIATIYG